MLKDGIDGGDFLCFCDFFSIRAKHIFMLITKFLIQYFYCHSNEHNRVGVNNLLTDVLGMIIS